MLFFDRRSKQTFKAQQQMQDPGTPAVPREVHPSLSETLADLETIYRKFETIVPRLQRQLQDPQIQGESELMSVIHKIWSVARDLLECARVLRARHGISNKPLKGTI